MIVLSKAEVRLLQGKWVGTQEYVNETRNIGLRWFETKDDVFKGLRYRIHPTLLNDLIAQLSAKRMGIYRADDR